MSKVTYQSKYRTVVVERDAYRGVCRLYVSEKREQLASWYHGVKPAREWHISRASEMIHKAAETIAPIFHGTKGPVAEVSTPVACN